MSYSDYREKRTRMKKENPIAWKFNHIHEILGRIANSICNTMNGCGWHYPPGSRYEELDYWYRWELENFNHTRTHAFYNFSKAEMENITMDVRKAALEYFKKAYELYQKGYRITWGANERMYRLNCKWFEKNIKRLEKIN